MSSLSGLVAHPGVSPYAASKFALEALAESLRGEVSSSGIDVLLVEPGRFRTELLGQRNLSAPLPAQDQSASAAVEAAVRAESGRQPGDPAKLAQIVVDVVKEEGVAEGRRMPERLLLGRDCVGEFEGKVGSLVGEIEGWREVAFSTDIEQ
jgi:NAD(P)-dependent dehydrogenase (short-subunit alcohol dehydrogenase family)